MSKKPLSVSVHHWRFEDGIPVKIEIPSVVDKILYPNGYRDTPARGWYCWAYPGDNREFEKWMKQNCPTAEAQHRFNGGDPMYTVQIYDDGEAMRFQEQWMSNFLKLNTKTVL